MWRFFAHFLSIGRAFLQERRRASNTGKLLKLLMPHQTDTGWWMFPKIVGKLPPNHPLKNRVFHYFHHPFWGIPIFGNTLVVSNICYFHPETWGKWFPLWRAYFSGGLFQPPTRIPWFMELLKMKKDYRSSCQIKVTSVSWCIPLKMQYQCPQFHQPWRYRNVRRYRWQFWLMVPGTKHNGCTNTSKRCSMW